MDGRPVLELRDVKMGFARVSDFYGETGAAMDMAGERGYILARVIPEIGYQGDQRALLQISGEKFRSHRYRVAYSCYWGLAWRIEQRGGNFVIFPPAEYRSSISPAVLKIRLCALPQNQFDAGDVPRATRDGAPAVYCAAPPFHLENMGAAIDRIARGLVTLEARVSKLEGGDAP